ncbi:MAG: phage gp6-like head-tail connector protein [Anaerolineae bacterium]|nr:phage gp6-like head-tail connector protein [Anaerolineae bacterium]
MNIYATLTDVRRYLGLSDSQTGDDDLLLRVLGAASRLIEGYTGRRFYPERAAQAYDCDNPAALSLRGDLLALHTLTNGDGSTIPASAYHLHPSGAAVVSSVLLDRTQAAFTHDGDPIEAIEVDGTWGYHLDWPDAWADSQDSVQNDPLNAGAILLLVEDADGADATGQFERFAVGQLIRIEDEYLHVLAINTTLNRLTVARGVNGTTATSHVQDTTIEVYQPPDDIRQACLRVASWLYKQKDAGFVQVTGGLRGQVTVPPALPDDVEQILSPYVRVQVA